MIFCLFPSQIFEWWYFRKYGTSFIEQVSVSHLRPLLGGVDSSSPNNSNASNGEADSSRQSVSGKSWYIWSACKCKKQENMWFYSTDLCSPVLLPRSPREDEAAAPVRWHCVPYCLFIDLSGIIFKVPFKKCPFYWSLWQWNRTCVNFKEEERTAEVFWDKPQRAPDGWCQRVAHTCFYLKVFFLCFTKITHAIVTESGSWGSQVWVGTWTHFVHIWFEVVAQLQLVSPVCTQVWSDWDQNGHLQVSGQRGDCSPQVGRSCCSLWRR